MPGESAAGLDFCARCRTSLREGNLRLWSLRRVIRYGFLDLDACPAPPPVPSLPQTIGFTASRPFGIAASGTLYPFDSGNLAALGAAVPMAAVTSSANPEHLPAVVADNFPQLFVIQRPFLSISRFALDILPGL